MEGDPFAVVEAMTIAGLRHRLRARLRLPARRVPARPPPPRARDRGGPPARLPRRRRDGQRLRASTSRSAAAPAPTSAARRRRSSTRIEGFRGEPRNKPPFPVEVGLFGQPTLGQQRRDAGQRAAHPARTAARRTRRPAPRARPARSCSASPAASTGRASTRCPSASRCASCSTLAGGRRRAGRSLQAVLLGGAAGAFVRPDELDMPLTFEGTASRGRHARLRRGHGARRHGRPRRRSCCASPPSSATSRAVSACRAGSAPSAQEEALHRLRHRRPRPAPASWRCSPTSAASCATRRSAGSARPASSAVESAIAQPGGVRDERRARVRSATPPAGRADRRRRDVQVAEGATMLDACRGAGRRHADAVLRRHAHAEERLPGVRRRGRGLAGARAGLLAPGRGRAWSCAPTPSGPATPAARARAARLVGRPVDRRRTSPAGTSEYGAEPDALRRRTPPPVRPAGQGRQRPLRAGLRQVHPLLQVRRRLRRAVAEHVRHRRRRARLRRPHLHRVRRRRCPTRPASTAATASRCARPAR